jgi:hypothetical protein
MKHEATHKRSQYWHIARPRNRSHWRGVNTGRLHEEWTLNILLPRVF